MTQSHFSCTIFMFFDCDAFGQIVGRHFSGFDVFDCDGFVFYQFPNEMVTYGNVFGACTVNWIGTQIDGTSVVAMNDGR